MRSNRPPQPDEAAWEASLLAVDTEVLLAMARNYLGAVKTPYDKRVIISRLAAFVRKPETRVSILALLDGLDARLVGTILLTGPLPESVLRELFRDELRVFDLALRIANLHERLVLFRMESAREAFIAVNPVIAGDLGPFVLRASVIFGGLPDSPAGPAGSPLPTPPARAGEAAEPAPSPVPPDGASPSGVNLVSAFYGLIHQFPGSLRKNGALSKRASARVTELLPALAARPARIEALVRGLLAAGALVGDESGEGGLEADAATYTELVESWKEALPLRLAASLVAAAQRAGAAERAERADALAHLLSAAFAGLPAGSRLTPVGLRRWLGIAAFRTGLDEESASIGALVEALGELGIAEGGWREGLPTEAAQAAGEGAVRGPVLVAEGSHLLRVLPEAGPEERWFALLLAEPRGFARVWELELDRDSMRRAFASGLSAEATIARLEELGARALPQSLAFSIRSWEDEYRSLRLYHGFVLVCDERKRNLVERNPALAGLVMEKLGEGVFMLAARSLEDIAQSLGAAGIEAPPEIHSHAPKGAPRPGSVPPPAPPPEKQAPRVQAAARAEARIAPAPADPRRLRREVEELWKRLGSEEGGALPFDPLPRIEALRAALAVATGSANSTGTVNDLAKELADRVERRLILDSDQLGRAELRIERLEAGGLDYSGKVRIVERALRSPGDRLEISYQLSGGQPERVLLRPVKLEKTDKGAVLEAEDLGTGGPIRVPLGAASSVRRLRAALFGDET